MTEYFLPRHVHLCRREDACVFLDLREDEYTLVNGNMAAALGALSLEGHPDGLQPGAARALEELLAAGLLTTDRNAGKRIAATQAAPALEPLLDPEASPDIRITIGHIRRFVAACTIAALRLRWRHIDETVKAVEQRKSRRPSQQHVDVAKAGELIAVFHKLRSLVPLDYLCLYDSLALIEFLARYRIFPTWVFGIKLEPWTAHCWVQLEQFTCNEGVEEATGYTPIMVI